MALIGIGAATTIPAVRAVRGSRIEVPTLREAV